MGFNKNNNKIMLNFEKIADKIISGAISGYFVDSDNKLIIANDLTVTKLISKNCYMCAGLEVERSGKIANSDKSIVAFINKALILDIPSFLEVDKNYDFPDKVVLKESLPKTWMDYVHQMASRDEVGILIKIPMPDEETAKPVNAMLKLINLYKAWVKDWKPVFPIKEDPYWAITSNSGEPVIIPISCYPKLFVFQTNKQAHEFLDCFKDLLVNAAPLCY